MRTILPGFKKFPKHLLAFQAFVYSSPAATVQNRVAVLLRTCPHLPFQELGCVASWASLRTESPYPTLILADDLRPRRHQFVQAVNPWS